MIDTLLAGPFLTRIEAAARLGVSADALTCRRDVLRVPGHHLEETYFAFQFDRNGLRPDVAAVVAALVGEWDEVSIADWLVRSNSHLSAMSPLSWIEAGRGPQAVIETAHRIPARHCLRHAPEAAQPASQQVPAAARGRRLRHLGNPAPAV
jgi:hypothetical protein